MASIDEDTRYEEEKERKQTMAVRVRMYQLAMSRAMSRAGDLALPAP
jgi:hypothetical protein